MLTAVVYGKSIKGKTVTKLLRKASKIANNYYNEVDKMVITNPSGTSCKFARINRKYPNNTIERGQWK